MQNYNITFKTPNYCQINILYNIRIGHINEFISQFLLKSGVLFPVVNPLTQSFFETGEITFVIGEV